MKWNWNLLCLLLTTYVHISMQKSTPDALNYTAAVVEFTPTNQKDASSTLNKNSNAYVDFIKQAKAQDVDIIVFPEYGLTTTSVPDGKEVDSWTTLIPAASENYVPCDKNTTAVSEALKKLSCAAKENEMYVVVNIAEKYLCSGNECPNDDVLYYNTNVVFDRQGKIIVRYRKTNLFLEPAFNVTTTPEIATFDTDFGVKFGTFICFDILFREPALNLTRHKGITDIVYSTAWFSEAPFLTAVQTQAGWAYSENVNLLASGYNTPVAGNGGSGIYLGRKGIGKAIMPFKNISTLIVFEVPKMQKSTSRSNNENSHHEESHETKKHIIVHDELRKKREDTKNELNLLHDDISLFHTIPVTNSTKETVCHNNYCCDFNIEITSIDSNVKYRIVAFNGIRLYGGIYDAHVRACGLIQCSNDSVNSCGFVTNCDTTFSVIDISTTIHDYKNMLIMPSTLNTTIYPLKNWSYEDHTHNDHVHIHMSLDIPMKNIVTFGIYVRDFGESNSNTIATNIVRDFGKSNSNTIAINIAFMFITVLIALF